MKIAFSPEIWLGQNLGGVSRYFVELMSGIEAAGHALVLPHLLHRNEFLARSTLRNRKFKLRFPHPTLVSLASRYNEYQFEKSLHLSGPDLIHETYYPTTPGARRGIPVITTIHDLIAENNTGSDRRDRLETEPKANSIRRASAVICVSETTKIGVEEVFPEARDKTVVIPLGVSPRFFVNDRVARDAQTEPFILYVGQRSGHKNFLALLRAYGSSTRVRSDFRLVLFGGGKLNSHELQMLGHHRIPPKKLLLISGDDEKLRGLYATAAAFVFPSLAEGFGLPLIEAGASGCAIFASDIPVMREVTGGEAIFFDPSDPGDLMAKLETYLPNQKLLRNLGERAQLNAGKFTWDQTVSKTVKAYENLLGRERLDR